MPTALGALRRLMFAPSMAEVTFDGRGFAPSPPAVRRRLESIPQAVVLGFEAGIEARDLREIEWRLDLVSAELRGFAYEGATMALTITDQLRPRARAWAPRLLRGPAAPHLFLTYIGIGFAMARLPRRRWSRVLPDLTGTPYYPELSWLAVDGYGFDLAFFHPRRWVEQQRIPPAYPWLGEAGYFSRAVDQGIGRALWFIHSAQVSRVAEAVARFAEPRRPDLWSGVGLAAAFAGGAGAGDLGRLATAAGEHRPELAQGAAFAAKARAFAGPVPDHTSSAVEVLCGLPAGEAAGLVDAAVAADATGPDLVYEQWRAYVRNRFARVGPHV
jgi:enediyne biosynthesis protein E2